MLFLSTQLLILGLSSVVFSSNTNDIDLRHINYKCVSSPAELAVVEAQKYVSHFCKDFDMAVSREGVYVGAEKVKFTLHYLFSGTVTSCTCLDELNGLFKACR